MDTARAIQAAVVRADLWICQIRASPWGVVAAGLLVGGFLWGIIKHNRRINHDKML